MMIRRYPFGAVESSPAISSNRVAKSAEGVAYFGLSDADGKGLIGILALADKMMKLKQVEGGEHVGYGEKSPFIGIEIVKEGGMPTDLGALAESALNEGVGILVEQVGGESFRIYKTRNVLLAGEVTSRVPNSAVAIEPAKGWVKPSAFDNKTLVIGGVVVGVLAIGGIAYYYSTRKPAPMRANKRSWKLVEKIDKAKALTKKAMDALRMVKSGRMPVAQAETVVARARDAWFDAQWLADREGDHELMKRCGAMGNRLVGVASHVLYPR